MNIEYEVRLLEIEKEKTIQKLESLGAELKWEALQKRYTYDFSPVIKEKWIRLRTNGNTSTLTIKNIVSSKIDGTQELEIEVDDFEKTNLILKELGYVPKAYQENKRCQYVLDGVEIDIDSWPLIPTYMEVEGKSEDEVYKILERLEVDYKNVTSHSVDEIYKYYGIDLDTIKELRFEEE